MVRFHSFYRTYTGMSSIEVTDAIINVLGEIILTVNVQKEQKKTHSKITNSLVQVYTIGHAYRLDDEPTSKSASKCQIGNEISIY